MKKTFVLILALLLPLLIPTSCSTDPLDNPNVEPEEMLMRDGEWEGTGEGRGGTILVRINVINHAIQEAKAISQSESSFAQEALNQVLANAVNRTDSLSLETDGVTGATLTSTGVIDAVNMAIAAAKGIQTDQETTYTDTTCDVVVIGAGGAGLSAAVEAASAGSRVIILEKQGILGGNTNYSTGGINAAETSVQQGLGIEDSKQLFFDDTMRGGHYLNDSLLVRSFVEH
ncbi:MAG: FAD-dependent oxidoreductase, partial [Parabacteroides sp.]|nr:FAD-dependent oxidoreductase [Parabacteroides sp.]